MTDYLWLSILLQTLELPIGIICCCVPNLKPAAVELSDACIGLINRVSCCSRRIWVHERHPHEPSPYQSTENESKAQGCFVRLDDSPVSIETDHLPCELPCHEKDNTSLRYEESVAFIV